jgi:4-hydroxy-tetrahydrodipicolinate reductase
MDIIVNGACGRMGKEVIRVLLEKYGAAVNIIPVDVCAQNTDILSNIRDYKGKAECIIDFSSHLGTRDLIDFALETKTPAVIATTGHTQEELDIIHKASETIPIFHSGNMSIGVALLVRLARETVRAMPDADVEIVEQHHNQKVDVPSGTALLLANGIKEEKKDAQFVIGRHENGKRRPQEIGIHSLRTGGTVGIHEVIISTNSQTITLKHEAHNRALFAEGAVEAAKFIVTQKNGIFDVNDMLNMHVK